MTMIKLSDGLYVAASQITEVYVNPFGNGITVVTKDDVRHLYSTEQGEHAYAALERLVAEINAATSKD